MLSKKLYNPVTGQKAINYDIIVFYTNTNGCYNSLRNNLKKTILSAIGRFKVSTQSKIPHIISSEIEWNLNCQAYLQKKSI
ncbi:6753_t:CDS:2 [Dentiscutata erythropus]|uniref:6753_t:CDS:1 n=1 Tax=Dentiscutata erythropus TaxID=1348616 RepID=A0A9N9NJ25_9GLOM|nr:6753_t:CDS:2 [Dentiscutata erythropus]